MHDVDLPEPKRVVLNVEQRQRRAHTTRVVVLYLLLLYSMLHKVLIPCILKFTTIAGHEYSRIDFWFLLPFAFFLVMRSPPLDRRAFVVLTTVAIIHAGYEIWRVSAGHYTGWMTFSHILSSLPLALICISIVTTPQEFDREL